MSERIVAKFGGSSVADARQIRKVGEIMNSDPRRRIVVVSAPGKRQPEESKLTDLLYLCQEMASLGMGIDEPFGLIRARYAEIASDLQLDSSILAAVDGFKAELLTGCSADYSASRGEYFCARLIAEYLGAECVDPADCIVLRADGTIAPESYALLGTRLADHYKRYVIAGFYGRDADGEIKTFSRGGSDISGAIAARAAGALCYENWTDTSGILMADPRIVANPRPITEISFREIREMAYMGASVFHGEAILPVSEVCIPINIRNTNSPDDPGTLIVPELSAASLAQTEIAGIAGKKGFTIISLEKSLMNREVGFVYRLMGILHQQGIHVEHCPSSIDSVSIIVEDQQLAGLEEVLLDQFDRQLQPDHIAVERDLALVAVVGEGMVRTAGIAGKIFSALGRAGINVRVINQGASEINILIAVSAEEYAPCVRVIYQAFTGVGGDLGE
ncbi:MAG: aspartate kinase [Desulfopila sp.]